MGEIGDAVKIELIPKQFRRLAEVSLRQN
jgi:hypothetical protein